MFVSQKEFGSEQGLEGKVKEGAEEMLRMIMGTMMRW